jgi:hypothetical protein
LVFDRRRRATFLSPTDRCLAKKLLPFVPGGDFLPLVEKRARRIAGASQIMQVEFDLPRQKQAG